GAISGSASSGDQRHSGPVRLDRPMFRAAPAGSNDDAAEETRREHPYAGNGWYHLHHGFFFRRRDAGAPDRNEKRLLGRRRESRSRLHDSTSEPVLLDLRVFPSVEPDQPPPPDARYDQLPF